MSGFFAALGARPADLLDRIAERARHRGTADVFADEQVVLAAFGARVHVEPDLVVAADARIDAGPSGSTDAERVARAWRAGTWQDLLGDFAAAVYERRTGVLHVIRDAVGGRPALTARTPERLLAGSSIPMLLADPAVSREADPDWIGVYLTLSPAMETITGYRDMARLHPGTTARTAAGRWDVAQWYTLPRKTVRLSGDAEYAEAFATLFEQAVRARIGNARRIAIPLSGGLDSTSVAATARALAPSADLLALSMPFFEAKGDERALQEMVARSLGMTQRWVEVIGRNPFGDGPEATIQTYGVPFASPNSFQIEALADAAAADGADVVLDGIDGDGVIGGDFLFIADLLVTGRWRTALRELNALQRTRGASRKRALKRLGIEPLLPGWAQRRRASAERPDWYGPDLLPYDPRIPWRPGRVFRTDHRVVLSRGMTAQVLEVMDEQYALRGLRIEHPFMDRRLIEFCVNLPREQVTANGYTKVVLRNAMRGRLPAAITDRAVKADVSEALMGGLSGVGREDVRRGMANLIQADLPHVRAEGVEALLAACERGAVPYEAFRLAWIGHWMRAVGENTVRAVRSDRIA